MTEYFLRPCLSNQRHIYCVIQNCWNFFPQRRSQPRLGINNFFVLPSMKFLSAHLFMPLILHVFYKRKRDSPLFMFPSGQGRQVCSPAHPCAPAVQPQGSRASSLRAGGGCAIQICISSLSLYGAWMTLNNQKILLVPFLICSSFESPPEDRDSF